VVEEILDMDTGAEAEAVELVITPFISDKKS
jgi:hypothetical protein